MPGAVTCLLPLIVKAKVLQNKQAQSSQGTAVCAACEWLLHASACCTDECLVEVLMSGAAVELVHVGACRKRLRMQDRESVKGVKR